MNIKPLFAILCGVLLVGILVGCSKQPTAGSSKTGDNESSSGRAEASKPTTAESSSATVVLGVTELTGGIPGEGKLTLDQIKQWLEDKSNHESLEVTLPDGLRAGQGAIEIPADNRMTRAKIELGRQLFFDKRLSADATVSCADCHHPDEGYTRHTQFGVGINSQTGDRNSPVSYNRILSKLQFWDGRAGSLEEQAVGPIANPIEMGNTHAKAVETIAAIEGYAIQFKQIFCNTGVCIIEEYPNFSLRAGLISSTYFVLSLGMYVISILIHSIFSKIFSFS